jgi:nucleotide-binding universal stress UspA family protein
MKVLVAIDDSEYSEAAVQSVIERTWPADTEFMIVTVVEPVFTEYAYPEGQVLEASKKAQEQLIFNREDLLTATIKRFRKELPQAESTCWLFEGGIAETIIREAKDWPADLIVLGSHGRSGLAKMFMGSVSEQVATRLPCSVEIVRPKKAGQLSDLAGKDQMAVSTK